MSKVGTQTKYRYRKESIPVNYDSFLRVMIRLTDLEEENQKLRDSLNGGVKK